MTRWTLAFLLFLTCGPALAVTESEETLPAPVESISAKDLRLEVRSVADQLKLIPRVAMDIPPCEMAGAKMFCIDETDLPAGSISDLSGQLIERVEVLRGPQGTLYGRDAQGGVLNLRLAGDSTTWCSYGSGAAVPLESNATQAEDEDELSPQMKAAVEYVRQIVAGTKDETYRQQISTLWASTQRGYALDPILGTKGSDGVFTFPAIGGGQAPGTKIVLNLSPVPPLDTIVTSPPIHPDVGGPIRATGLDAKRFYFVPKNDLKPLFGNAASSTNLCRDKQLVPSIDWSAPGAALPASPQDGAIPSSTVRLPR